MCFNKRFYIYVVVGISFSGTTVEVAKLLELAKRKNIKTISITKYGKTLVSNYADIRLHTTADKELTFQTGLTFSRIGQLQMIDILYMCLASHQYEKTIKRLNKIQTSVEFLKKS